jgi:hypothetical protein
MNLNKELKKLNIETNTDENGVVDLGKVRHGLLTGGGGPDENWLKDLKQGDVFVAKRKKAPPGMQDNIAQEIFWVMEHKNDLSNLIQKMPDNRQFDLWFNSLEFSRTYTLSGVVTNIQLNYKTVQDEIDNPSEEKEEENSDDGTGSVQQ